MTLSFGLDSYLLLQLEEQVGSIKIDLSDVTRDIVSSEKEDEDLLDQKDRLCKSLFDLSLQIMHLLHNESSSPSTLETESQVKLLEIDVPMFNMNILHCNTFWEQFEVSIHFKTHLTKVEKLVYIWHALKGRPAKQAKEGLSRSADRYEEGIGCLKRHYD